MQQMDGTLEQHWNIIDAIELMSKRCSEKEFLIQFFKHKYMTQPMVTPSDAVIKAMADLKAAISNHMNKQAV